MDQRLRNRSPQPLLARIKRKARSEQLPEHLPRYEVIVDLTKAEKAGKVRQTLH